MSHGPIPKKSAWSGLWHGLQKIGVGIQLVVALIALGTLIYFAVPYLRAAAQPAPPPLPASMVAVNWHDPASSQYCLACHKQVSPAMAVLNVERGHSQNVELNEVQRAAVEEMGTVVGPDETLICMSCHQLGDDNTGRYMLADTLEDSRLCQQCHPGHYAQGTPHDLRVSAPDEMNRLGQTVTEGGPCSACHLSHSFARRIARSALDPEGYCLPCHSAYHVAAGHARTTMDHPESRCLECHNPHDATHGAFLKAEISKLCIECHEGYDGGIAGGMHPLGHMDEPVPAELIAAGAHMLGHPQELTCVVCHDTHRAEHRALLHVTPDANRLCLMCHEDKLLAQTHDGVLPRHGQQPILNASQRAVVATWGNPVGPQGELLCISCHRVHNARPETELLTFNPRYGETCGACHPAEETVFGTPHDLRTNFPDLANDAGLTAGAAGACSACHMAHRFPRARVVTAGDPAGQCVTCHQPGACGEAQQTGKVDHPKTRCGDCHNPHERQHGDFLKTDELSLCSSCHEEQKRLIGGPHDMAANPEAWPEAAQAAGGRCLPCHVPHGGEREDLYRFRTPTGFGLHDGVCLTCHEDAAWGAQSEIAAIHPRQVAPEHSHVNLSLVPTDLRGDKRMGCRTCHDPHGPPKPAQLARVAVDEPTEALCLRCHVEKQLITLTGHSPETLRKAGYETDSCKPCHAMHAAPDAAWGQVLSPRFLLSYCDIPEGASAASCVPCLACHQQSGKGPVRTSFDHPDVLTMNVYAPDDPGYLPLFGKDGRVDQQGQVTCRTCHVSHGRLDLLHALQVRGELTAAQRDQIKAQIRPFVSPNICTTCHGPQARVMFLFFHEPGRRGAVGATPLGG